MFDPGTSNCQARVGLLILRECAKPAVCACSECGLPLCSEHAIAGTQGVFLCPDCGLRAPQVKPSDEVELSRQRRHYYDAYHYIPRYYVDGSYYTAGDYETMRKYKVSAEVDEKPAGPTDEGVES